ncbi:MAG TPA: divalent-cation tolerance protein CutA [Gemmatimonadales bacterium]|nr:divalent-cation tolerance protein CutA [Gemmatimonadales bacterium]
MDCVQVSTTVESRDAADRLAAALVTERLAACAHVAGPIASTYRWAGSVERAEEWYCHFKTTRARLEGLMAAIRARHSYELPEIVVVPLGGSEEYLRWIAESVG